MVANYIIIYCISKIRFVKIEDKKRALLNRLLQYAPVHEGLGIPFNEIIIKRPLEGKPYLEDNKLLLRFPNFNFNVSHDGDYVAIASEPLCLVGLDIVSTNIPERETVPELVQNFSSYFSTMEWDNIVDAGSDDEVLDSFCWYWCLKEAFVKAIGIGVGYRLDRIEFHHISWTGISVQVNGKVLKDWRFWFFELGKGHLVSIARGHPCTVAENFKKTL